MSTFFLSAYVCFKQEEKECSGRSERGVEFRSFVFRSSMYPADINNAPVLLTGISVVSVMSFLFYALIIDSLSTLAASGHRRGGAKFLIYVQLNKTSLKASIPLGQLRHFRALERALLRREYNNGYADVSLFSGAHRTLAKETPRRLPSLRYDSSCVRASRFCRNPNRHQIPVIIRNWNLSKKTDSTDKRVSVKYVCLKA